MKDNLEQLVKNNREAFDDKVPERRVWDNISRKLEGSHRYDWLWKVAAVVFFVCTVGLTASHFVGDANNLTAQQDQVNEEFESIESFYFEMISEKKSMIYDFEAENEIVDQAFEQDLQKLDAMYQVLKEELRTNPSKQVVDALILNLLVRIDILNKQLQELDNIEGDQAENSQQVNV